VNVELVSQDSKRQPIMRWPPRQQLQCMADDCLCRGPSAGCPKRGMFLSATPRAVSQSASDRPSHVRTS